MSDYILDPLENDDILDAILKQAIIKNHLNRLAAMPSDEELEKMYTLSDGHYKKMKKLFTADKRRETFTVVLRWSKVAVVTVCVTATVMFATLLTSADVRKVIGDTIITWFSQFTQFESAKQPAEDDTIFFERDWSLSYLSEGFELLDSVIAGETTLFMYMNPKGSMIDFKYMPSRGSISVDNEDREYDTIVENDVIYHIFEVTDGIEGKQNILIWDMNGYRFTVAGEIDIDELMKIALSVK
jgi:hypothetical protein